MSNMICGRSLDGERMLTHYRVIKINFRNMDNNLTPKSSNKSFEDIKKIDENGVEYWEARKLMEILEYTEWRNFEKVIEKAKSACKLSEQDVLDHFVDINKSIKGGKGANKLIFDYKLSR